MKKKAIHLIKVKVLKYYRAMDSVRIIIQSLLASLGNLTQPQQKFLVTLFSTLLISCGRATFTNLGRYSCLIEFIFRDSKQFTGLADCQARDLTKLDFHFNSSLTVLNLAKWDAIQQHNSDTDFVFSMASYKRRARREASPLGLNYHLLERFIDKLDLEPTLIKSHPNYSNLCDYGAIAA